MTDAPPETPLWLSMQGTFPRAATMMPGSSPKIEGAVAQNPNWAYQMGQMASSGARRRGPSL